MGEPCIVRVAVRGDAIGIMSLIEENYGGGRLMRVPKGAIEDAIGSFMVAERNGKLVGCCSLHKHGSKLYELGALSVSREARGDNIGLSLMARLLSTTRSEDFVFVGTQIPEYAKRIGFLPIRKRTIPMIVWLHKLNTLLRQDPRDWIKIIKNAYVFMKLDFALFMEYMAKREA